MWKVRMAWRAHLKLSLWKVLWRVGAGAELVSLGVVSAGCQDGCEWPRDCVFMGPEYKGRETKHGTWNQNPWQDFQGNKPLTVSPLSRWASCQMGATYLGSNSTHTSRFLKPVQGNHLSSAHNSLLAGEGGIFTTFGRVRKVPRSEWTDSRQVTPRPWWNRCKEVISPGELVSLCLQPLQLYHSTFWGTFRVCFPVRPSLAWLSGRFFVCLYFLSCLHTVVGMELIHFDHKSFWQQADAQT